MSRVAGQGDRRVRYRWALHWALPVAPALGLVTLLLVQWGSTDGFPHLTTELLVWQVLLATQVVVWTVLAGVGLRRLGQLDAYLRAWWLEDQLASRGPRWWRSQTAALLGPVYGALLLMFVFAEVADIRNVHLFPGLKWKMPLLHLAGGLAALPYLVELRWVQLSAAEPTAWPVTTAVLERIHAMRRRLRSATAAVGVIIALAVIATGMNRQAVIAAGEDPLPESLTFLYGGWFTAVLAAVYLSVFSALDARARQMLDEAVPLPEPNPDPETIEEFTSRAKMRNAFADELELGGDPRKNLEGLIAVFSPLLGALLTKVGGLPAP